MMELHGNFVQIKNELEDAGVASDQFEEYEELDVTPDRQHCSKQEHKHAIFLLGEALADTFSEGEFSDAGQLKRRMAELKEEVAP